MKHKYQAYAAATQTVAKTRQIVMLYDGAIRFIHQAKDAIRDRKYEERYKLLIKAGDVIVGLQSCLDFDRGGEIAKILYHFYASVDNRLFTIHRTNSLEECDQVLADLRQMREVWDEIDKSSAGDVAEQETTPVAAADDSGGQPPPALPDAPVTLSA